MEEKSDKRGMEGKMMTQGDENYEKETEMKLGGKMIVGIMAYGGNV